MHGRNCGGERSRERSGQGREDEAMKGIFETFTAASGRLKE